jgi:hypothetical protein
VPRETVDEGRGMTLEEQIKSVEREITMRERVYPRWVAAGKMKQEKALFEIAAMRAVLETLKRVPILEDAEGELADQATRRIERAR